MDEIAAQAGISKRTVYRHFKSKDEIVEAVIDRFLGLVGNKIEEIITSEKTVEDKFSDIINSFYHIGRSIINSKVMQDLSQHYPHYWKKIDDYRMKNCQRLIAHFIDKSDKDVTRGINPKIVTTAVLASIQAVLNPSFILSNGLTFEETVHQMVKFFKCTLFQNNVTCK